MVSAKAKPAVAKALLLICMSLQNPCKHVHGRPRKPMLYRMHAQGCEETHGIQSACARRLTGQMLNPDIIKSIQKTLGFPADTGVSTKSFLIQDHDLAGTWAQYKTILMCQWIWQ